MSRGWMSPGVMSGGSPTSEKRRRLSKVCHQLDQRESYVVFCGYMACMDVVKLLAVERFERQLRVPDGGAADKVDVPGGTALVSELRAGSVYFYVSSNSEL